MRVLCLDVGAKTIGVALSDPLGWTAQGLATLKRRGTEDFKAVAKLVAEQGVEKILVGLPLLMNGTEGDQARKVREFVIGLEPHLQGTPVLLRDERLSTAAAERGLLEADLSRAKRRRVIDKMAAVFILQGYLDSL